MVATFVAMALMSVVIVVMVAAVLPVFVVVGWRVRMIVGGHGTGSYFSKNMTSRPRTQSRPPSTPLS